MADLAVFLGKPGITYPNADPSNDWHAAAGLDLTGLDLGTVDDSFGPYPLISLNALDDDANDCFTDFNLPARCRARIQTPLCTRYVVNEYLILTMTKQEIHNAPNCPHIGTRLPLKRRTIRLRILIRPTSLASMASLQRPPAPRFAFRSPNLTCQSE